METRVRVYDGQTQGKAQLLGFADLVIERAFVIRGIRILRIKSESKEGRPTSPFISFPSRKASSATEQKYFDVAHPITTEAYHAAADMILAHYQRVSSAR